MSFCGPDTLFWTSGDVSSEFRSQSGQSYSHLVEAYMMYIPWDLPLVWHLPTCWWPALWLVNVPYMYVSAEIECWIWTGDFPRSSLMH